MLMLVTVKSLADLSVIDESDFFEGRDDSIFYAARFKNVFALSSPGSQSRRLLSRIHQRDVIQPA